MIRNKVKGQRDSLITACVEPCTYVCTTYWICGYSFIVMKYILLFSHCHYPESDDLLQFSHSMRNYTAYTHTLRTVNIS
jgi:hypothetical protein